MAQYAYTSESGSRLISDHGSDVLNSQSDERQFKPRVYNSIKIEDFVYESWPPLLRYGGGASVTYFDSPITSIVCSNGICVYSYDLLPAHYLSINPILRYNLVICGSVTP